MPDKEQQRIQVARQDRREFDLLFGEHRDRLYRLCLRILCSPEDAEDALLETSLRAYQSLAGFRGDSTLATWLFRLARNACIDIARRRKAGPSLHDLADTPDTHPTPEQEIVGSPIVGDVLERAKTARPPWDKLDYLIFALHYGEGMELKEIARREGKAESTIRGRVHDHIKPVFEQIRHDIQRSNAVSADATSDTLRLKVEES